FMAGYVLGAFLFRNVADNTKKPSLVFSILQGAIGIYGLLIIPMFKLLPTLYISLLEVPGSQFLQFALGFLVIIIPATLFGATWPVMNKAYIKVKVGKDAGMLYSLNSVGAVFGSIAAGFLLIPSLGLMRTSITASILNLVSASIIFLVWKRNEG
ncbi:MAG: fused MFS/spermidine synthase, partial [Nanoarchaeota archaeon]|nr:fused MFS/spermidine synthase [Nanoarchaeota archaeon]MCG2719175.1 fused MFS/spermidine synthase [Nanoarchaeota archaeon]